MTLLAEIQEVIERTYRPRDNERINLEDCLIGPTRSHQLYSRCGLPPADWSSRACTFLRTHEDQLFIAIYYSPDLIDTLEQEDPRNTLSHRNIGSLISFIEEITHALHAIWAFRSGFRQFESEAFACNLEVQAKVDTYWLLLRFVGILTGSPPDAETKNWILDRLIGDDRHDYQSHRLAKRYRFASVLAASFIRTADPLSPPDRVQVIRSFRSLPLLGKRRLVRTLLSGDKLKSR